MNVAGLKILMIEDDVNMRYLVRENLESRGFEVEVYDNGLDGFKAFCNGKFDMCIVDVMMPHKDGFSVVRDIRKIDHNIPVIFLTSKAQEKDRIEGLIAGADDYVTKPFSMKELLLRIYAILKRCRETHHEKKDEQVVEIGYFRFDPLNHTLAHGMTLKDLTAKESALLKILIDHKNTVVDRSLVLKTVWGSDDFHLSKNLDVYITRLRKILKADSSIVIKSIYGDGYKLIVNE
jgi:DNA-binding response OmpR family regulator